jgi:hypothetical protein
MEGDCGLVLDESPVLLDLAVCGRVEDVDGARLEALAVAFSADRADAHGVLVVGEHVVDVDLEGATGLLEEAAEHVDDLFLALVVAGEHVVPADVPHDVVGEQPVDRRHVSFGERCVALAQERDVGMLGHGSSFSRVPFVLGSDRGPCRARGSDRLFGKDEAAHSWATLRSRAAGV